MSDITVTAEKKNEAVLMKMTVTNESREHPDDADKEQYRSMFRVVVSQEGFNVTDVSTPDETITEARSLTVRFNQTETVILEPFSDFQLFKLVSQEYTPYMDKGSRMFSGVKEWETVSEWLSLEWCNA